MVHTVQKWSNWHPWWWWWWWSLSALVSSAHQE